MVMRGWHMAWAGWVEVCASKHTWHGGNVRTVAAGDALTHNTAHPPTSQPSLHPAPLPSPPTPQPSLHRRTRP